MSQNGMMVFSQAVNVEPDPATGIMSLRVDYRYSWVEVGMEGGTIYVVLENRTESELNTLAQQAVLLRANQERPGFNFILSDIHGGRI